jgi:hypothetical protein
MGIDMTMTGVGESTTRITTDGAIGTAGAIGIVDATMTGIGTDRRSAVIL